MKITLELTEVEARVLRDMVDGPLRDMQGDGSLPDDEDDALVSLNDKVEAALNEVSE